MSDLGITEFGRDRIIRAAYDAVGIITYFTAGEPEVRGWNLEKDSNAVEAAGKIHTDLAKGFIRAEVTAFEDLKQAGSIKEAKARHLQRLEGKDYIVKDGDVPALASAIGRMMDDRGLRARLGEQAIGAMARYTPEAVGAEWDALLDDLVRPAPARRPARPRVPEQEAGLL